MSSTQDKKSPIYRGIFLQIAFFSYRKLQICNFHLKYHIINALLHIKCSLLPLRRDSMPFVDLNQPDVPLSVKDQEDDGDWKSRF